MLKENDSKLEDRKKEAWSKPEISELKTSLTGGGKTFTNPIESKTSSPS